jgi:serine/threonine-protein kinase
MLVGTVIEGKYRVIRLIGEGGAGQVFEAQHITAKHLVAVKVPTGKATRESLVRLEREAHIVGAIRHPNVCKVLDVGHMPDGAPYVAFERLFGETLAERTRGRQLTINEAMNIFSQMLAGLEAAHDANIVHRDLKPENVFLVDGDGCDPVVKVVDFGFARDLTTSTARITKPGRACGTMQYMSPEQLRLNPVDHRSDLFAVGIMLYEVLAGRHPFEAPSVTELQINILRAAPVPIRNWRPDLPVELDALIATTLARSPTERPSSAAELRVALQSMRQNVSLPSLVEDDPVSTSEPLWRPRKTSPSA